ncbi:hypothetical protein BJ944DRAFT_153738, partial [Cunninghamella echinulata]
YYVNDGEFYDGSHCDVLYISKTQHPPIIVEIQNSISDRWIALNAIKYCQRVYNEKKKAILLVFCITNPPDQVCEYLKQSNKHPFADKYPCVPWAKKCYLISPSSVKKFESNTLSPLIALSLFLFEQQPAILFLKFAHDPILQQLYELSVNLCKS